MIYPGVVGLIKNSGEIIDLSFDILSLEALVLVPRVCALLSLHPYFGTLVEALSCTASPKPKHALTVYVRFHA